MHKFITEYLEIQDGSAFNKLFCHTGAPSSLLIVRAKHKLSAAVELMKMSKRKQQLHFPALVGSRRPYGIT